MKRILVASQFKLRPLVVGSLAVIISFFVLSYLRVDLALSNLALKNTNTTAIITYQKPNGEIATVRVLTSAHDTDQELEPVLSTPSDLPIDVVEDDEQQSATIKELVLESIKEFLQDEQIGTDLLRDPNPWLNHSRKSEGAKYLSEIEDSTREVLRNVLLELRQLREARNSSDAATAATDSESDDLEDDDWRKPVIVDEEDSAEVGEFKFRALGRLNLRRLVLYSSYRDSPTEFSVITLTPALFALTRMGGAVYNICLWMQDDGSSPAEHFSSLENMNSTNRLQDQTGTITSLRYVNETHGRNYDTLVIQCSFPEPVGSEGTGGLLYLKLSHSIEPEVSELVPVFRERPGQYNSTLFNLSTFQYEYVYCSPPVWTNLSAVYVKEWFKYHHALLDGNVRYFVYDNIGIDNETMAVLQPFIDAGILTVINQHRERDYDAWWHTQATAINDCIKRARFIGKWVLFWDFDEYLSVSPPLTLSALLEDVEQKGAPWITFGNMYYSINYCAAESGSGDDWAIERMLYRIEKPQCEWGEFESPNVCTGPMGHRKWIGNPRLTLVGSIHYVIEPGWGGVDLDTNIARINHYRGIVAPDAIGKTCSIIKDPLYVNATNVDGWLFMDDELSSFTTQSLKVRSQSFSVLQHLIHKRR
ncbi:hypothetical protein R1flu_012517 [Riccia fluitans]|uniref:Glycosyltransferase family 92 protein n=1 Tax=Riccia fluitans TaxID=41844 RepID=A0ABD1ZBU6_9MARC